MHLTTTGSLTVRDLRARGFKKAEIKRLVALAEHDSPYREVCATDLELERLAFLKWRYDHGQVPLG